MAMQPYSHLLQPDLSANLSVQEWLTGALGSIPHPLQFTLSDLSSTPGNAFKLVVRVLSAPSNATLAQRTPEVVRISSCVWKTMSFLQDPVVVFIRPFPREE
jgi:hypothetical protein